MVMARVTLTPCRDPLRTLVYSASPADLSRVMVAGRTVVEQGRVVGSDESAVAAAHARLWAALPELDWAGRAADALSPPSLSRWAPPADPSDREQTLPTDPSSTGWRESRSGRWSAAFRS